MDGDGHILGVGQNDVPLHQRAIQAQLPAAGGTLQAGLEIVQVHAETLELANLQVGATQQASLFGTFPGHVLFDQLHPGCGIQFVDAAAHAQALGARQRRRATSKHQFATAFVQLAHGRRQGQAGEPGIVQPVAPLVAVQGHTPAGVASICLRLAKWCRQVDRQTLEAGVDAQLAVLALQGQVQVVGQHARGRQGLADAEPGREVLQGDATIGENARTSLAVAALGPGLDAHFAAEGLAADVLGAEASGGVVAESTLEPGKGQLRTGDLQLGVGRAQVHHDMGRVALLQGDVEFQAAVQRALALPAGEDGAGTDRRFLENLQPVGEVAGQLGVQQQVRYLAGLHMGHLGFGVAHSSVEDPAGRHLDPHAGVLDEHIATGLAQFRPTWLESQPGVMHFEEQAEGTCLRAGALGQGALVLEEALVHRAALDRFLQPLGQGRAEAWRAGRQVLLGVAGVAVAQADAQVHVVLGLGNPHQADQHVAGDVAFLPRQAHVGTGQGEGSVIQAPGQPRAGLAVTPGLGKELIQVQDEVVRVQAQFALLEIASQAAAGIVHGGRATVGIEAHAGQVAAELQALGVFPLRPVIQVQVAQGATRLEPGDDICGLLGQRHQGTHHR
ncbi:hypothetical protein D3C84_368970 [compost metagenome]